MEKEITVGESPVLTAVSPKPQAHQQNAAKTKKKKIHILLVWKNKETSLG